MLGSDDYWTVLVRNLQRVLQKWVRLTRLLGIEGVDARTLIKVYVAVVQETFLYGLDTWVMTPHIGRYLGRFHHRVAR